MGRARLRRIRERLRTVYGTPALPPHHAPLDELVLTVLSQSTNDRNRDVAYLRLRERFAAPAGTSAARAGGVSWEAVRDAPVEEVEEAIRPGGIAKVKSERIQAILRAIGDRAPDGAARRAAPFLSLDHLANMPVEEAREELLALPGVGRKTAACVLLFSFGARDVPVDTHVGRVGQRLAILPEVSSHDALHDAMLAATPRGAELELHVNLLRHGRRTCHAQRPACERCALRRSCPSRRA